MRYTMLGIIVCATALVACGGGSSGGASAPQDDTGLLRRTQNAAELEQAIKAGFTTIRDSGTESAALMAGGAAADASSGNFTGTYTQELSVDEFDAVRYDGDLLYVAPRRYPSCCFILGGVMEDGAIDSGNDPQRSIRILASDPANAEATLQSSIPLEEDIFVPGMYLAGDRMFALTAQSVYGHYGDFWADIAIWAPEKLGFRVYDVSDPANPALSVDVSIDGVFIDSRRIGNTVYIVSRYSPTIDGIYYNVSNADEQAHNQALLRDLTLDDLAPKIRINGEAEPLIRPDRCYVPADSDEVGYPVITSITAVPIDDPGNFQTTCYNDDSYGIYASATALYLTELRFDPNETSYGTRIHKFGLSATAVTYRGSGDVDGQVWRGGQSDFRMSEHNGDLRVMSTQFEWNNIDAFDHQLFVLRESASRRELTVVSQLPNAARPEEIGKPNEALYGVRFLGDRAYAVTFLQIDPLYVIDLADPADPKIAGELNVEGFSDFLHPVSDELLLGLGRGGNGGVKIELFDVSDLNLPLSRGSVTLGGLGTHSEATWDRHAFTYQADVGGVDRFAIPVTLFEDVGPYGRYSTNLHLFEIHDTDTPALTSLAVAGVIEPPAADDWVSRNRTFVHDDTVYYIQNEFVWAAFWHTPSLVSGPF